MSDFVFKEDEDGKVGWQGQVPEPPKPEVKWIPVHSYMGMGGNGTSIYMHGYRCGTCRAFVLGMDDDQEEHERYHRALRRLEETAPLKEGS